MEILKCYVLAVVVKQSFRKEEIAQLKNDIFLERIIVSRQPPNEDQRSSSICDVCNSMDGNTTVQAEIFCEDCQESFCGKCSAHHQRMKLTKEHRILPIECASRVAEHAKCKHHKDTALNLICIDCTLPVCLICFVTKHKSHDCADLTEFCKDLKQQLKLSNEKLTDRMSSFDNQAEYLNLRRKTVLKGITGVQSQAIEIGKEIKNMVDECIRNIVLKSQAFMSTELEILDKLNVSLQNRTAVSKNFETYLREVIDKAIPYDLLHISDDLKLRAKRITDATNDGC